MRVFYIGKYRAPSVSYCGEVFTQGIATEVSEEWYATHKSERLTVEQAAESHEVELVKRRGRPKVKRDDND